MLLNVRVTNPLQEEDLTRKTDQTTIKVLLILVQPSEHQAEVEVQPTQDPVCSTKVKRGPLITTTTTITLQGDHLWWCLEAEDSQILCRLNSSSHQCHNQMETVTTSPVTTETVKMVITCSREMKVETVSFHMPHLNSLLTLLLTVQHIQHQAIHHKRAIQWETPRCSHTTTSKRDIVWIWIILHRIITTWDLPSLLINSSSSRTTKIEFPPIHQLTSRMRMPHAQSSCRIFTTNARKLICTLSSKRTTSVWQSYSFTRIERLARPRALDFVNLTAQERLN